MTADFVRSFQIEGMNVRGRIVHLTDAADRVLGAHGYPDSVSRVVGEALALAALLGASLKFDGTLTIQTRGKGPLKMVVADYNSPGAVRACATFDRDAVERLGANPSFEALVGEGASLAITIDQGADMERYQGIVPLEGEGLADGAMSYFERSEQIPTRIKLGVATLSARGADGARPRWRAGAIMIQNLAALGGQNAPRVENADDWVRASALFATTEAHELVDPQVEAERLLYRLFHEDGVRVFERQELAFGCRCSADRVMTVLTQYPEQEIRGLADEGGMISATCEFCSTTYRFKPEDVHAAT